MAITLYSSGPMEPEVTGISSGVVNVENLNSTNSVAVRVRLFDLNGTRDLVFEDNFSVESFSSNFTSFGITEDLGNYSITVRLDTEENVDLVLISYWGRDADSNIIPSQRLVHEEFHRLPFTFSS
jgi:hypothetical protein